MASTSITNTKIKFNLGVSAEDPVAVTSTSDGCVIDFSHSDGRILILLHNGDASPFDVKVLAGNGIQGTNDLSVNVAANKTTALVLESGAFMNVSGENKGKVKITGNTNLKVQAFELP